MPARPLLRDTVMREIPGPPQHPHTHRHPHHHHVPMSDTRDSPAYTPVPGAPEPRLKEGDVKSVELKERWVVGVGTETTPVEVFVMDEHYQYMSRILFWITIMELLMGGAFALVGALVVTDTFTNNNYLFVVIGGVLSVVIVMVLHGFAVIRLWSRSSSMSHHHNREVRMPFFFGIFLLGIGFFVLGRWITDNCDCCDADDCQPDDTNFAQLAEYYAAWGIFTILDFIWVYTIVRALYAHVYPEVKVPTTADPFKATLPLDLQEEIDKADAKRPTLEAEAEKIVQSKGRRRVRGGN